MDFQRQQQNKNERDKRDKTQTIIELNFIQKNFSLEPDTLSVSQLIYLLLWNTKAKCRAQKNEPELA
jgi:hypothetical protein